MLLRTRIMLVAVITSLVVAATMSVLGSVNTARMETRFQDATLDGRAALWDTIVEAQVAQMQGNVTGLTRDRALIGALADGDAEQLARSARPTYNRLSASGLIDRLEILDAEAAPIFESAALPPAVTPGAVLAEALRERSIATGIERLGDGSPAVSVVFPLYNRGQLAGFGRFSRLVDGGPGARDAPAGALGELARHSGVTAWVVDHAGGSWGHDQGGPAVEQLLGDVPTSVSRTLRTVHHNGSVFSLALQPLHSAQGEAIAHLVTAGEVTAVHQARKRAEWLGYLLTLVVVVGAAGLLGWLLARNILSRLGGEPEYALAKVRTVAAGDLTVDIELRPGDESSLLAALKQMTSTLAEAIREVETGCQAIASGDLAYRITHQPQGDLVRLRDAVNGCADQLERALSGLAQAVDAVGRGDFSTHVDTDAPGAYGTLLTRVAAMAADLDQAVGMINRTMGDVAVGRFEARVNQPLQGDLETLRQRLNQSLTAVDTGIDQLSQALAALAAGDLSRQMSGEHQGRFAGLQHDFNRSIEAVAAIVLEARKAAGDVAAAAEEVSGGSRDLSERTQRQAASLEETAASMEQMTGTVRQSSEQAREADRVAAATSERTQAGREVMERTTAAMEKIRAASSRIEEITTLIDSIAFQTNLLALNAAVEAARAGEQGRGFAVVAGEVKSLAQRSASAAGDIKALVAQTTQDIGRGSALLAESSQALVDIDTSVASVRQMLGTMATAAGEQATGIEQVSQSVVEMDEMTQQNAALVEQTSAAAMAMRDQADQLTALMDRFLVASSVPLSSPDDTTDADYPGTLDEQTSEASPSEALYA
ncbi:MAG: hypothetical protein JJT93_06550 [Gammaproteobacteria bacterium]|nr:hypothetical protein [Gammaproteobacteria bacterium]